MSYFFINIYKELKYLFSSLNIIIDTKNISPKNIIFSESRVYQKFSKPILEIILSKNSDVIYYFSIDKEDKIKNERVRNYYINPLLINYIFKNLKAKNLFLTVTDLGNNLLKKTKNIENYIYYFHSPVSTTKNYTSKAFDNYDIIMCIGQFQIDEIRARERLNKLSKKKLIPTGYFYFDYLSKKIDYSDTSNQILIAPSWNKNIQNYLNENFIELIDALLKKKFKVIFRPHPEHFKRSKKILDFITKKFSSNLFSLDTNVDNVQSMQKAKCLITDSSGISIEYMIVMKRPVLYLNEHDKIHNSEYTKYSNFETIDHKIKKNFGFLFYKEDFDNIDIIITKSENLFLKKIPELKNFINDNYFHFGNTTKYLSSYLKNII